MDRMHHTRKDGQSLMDLTVEQIAALLLELRSCIPEGMDPCTERAVIDCMARHLATIADIDVELVRFATRYPMSPVPTRREDIPRHLWDRVIGDGGGSNERA